MSRRTRGLPSKQIEESRRLITWRGQTL